MQNTPENTRLDWSPLPIERNILSKRQKINGPLTGHRTLAKGNTERMNGSGELYQRSQFLSPSLIPPCKTTSASGSLLTSPRRAPILSLPNPVASPRSADPPLPPPPRIIMPPSRYCGQRTCLIFSHTARRSRESVSQTDSSIVFCGARRSSPGMDEVRYELDTGFREAPPAAEDDEMFPVNGVRSVVEPSGSSASMAT